MITPFDCIERIPDVLERIIDKRKENMQALLDSLGDDVNRLRQLVLVGSGTSSTASVTAAYFAEKVSGIEVKSTFPSVFCNDISVYNQDALYVFISQTGTSKLTSKAQALIKARGFHSVCISESEDTPMAKAADCFLDMGCGYEEFPMRTIGYSSSVLTIMLMGLEIGLKRGNVSKEQYDKYILDARAMTKNLRDIPKLTLDWLQQKSQWQLLRSQCIVFTGTGSLYGVALEAAVKTWETPKITAIGYELEEGMHGPNFGYSSNHCVIVLNDGGADSDKALSLARYMKEIFHNGFVVGSAVVDENDLMLSLSSGDFCCLELVCVPQILSCKLAKDLGRDLQAPHDNSVMYSYFETHAEEAK